MFRDERYEDWYNDHKDDVTEGYLERNEEDYAEYCIHRFNEWKKRIGIREV